MEITEMLIGKTTWHYSDFPAYCNETMARAINFGNLVSETDENLAAWIVSMAKKGFTEKEIRNRLLESSQSFQWDVEA